MRKLLGDVADYTRYERAFRCQDDTSVTVSTPSDACVSARGKSRKSKAQGQKDKEKDQDKDNDALGSDGRKQYEAELHTEGGRAAAGFFLPIAFRGTR